MPNTNQVIDSFIITQPDGSYHVAFQELTENDRIAIANYVKDRITLPYNRITGAPGLPDSILNNDELIDDTKFTDIAFSGSYNDLIDAPGLPADEGDSSVAYETISGVRRIKDFNTIAFTGIDLNDINANIEAGFTLDLSQLASNCLDFNQEDTRVLNLGSEDIVIPLVYKNNQQNIFETSIKNLRIAFTKAKACYISNNIGNFLITDSNLGSKNGSECYYSFTTALMNPLNGETIDYDDYNAINQSTFNAAANDENESNAALKALMFSQIHFESTAIRTFIFDFNSDHPCIICKLQKTISEDILSNYATQSQINDIANNINISYDNLIDKPQVIFPNPTSNPELYEEIDEITGEPTSITPEFSNVAFTGNYDDLIDVPNLSDVAISGSYNDLSNRPQLFTSYILNLCDYIYTDENGEVLNETDNNKLNYLGSINGYLDNINTLRTENNILLKDSLMELLTNFQQNNNSLLIIQNNNQKFLINNIVYRLNINNVLLRMIIDMSPIVTTNYGILTDELQAGTKTKEQILANANNDGLKYSCEKPILIFDCVNDVCFSKLIPIVSTMS